jgi:hypothetical protein
MSATEVHVPPASPLRPGEVVRVRSAREIFRTLDEHGALEGVPFMPEMLRHCGRTLTVFKRADKTCDAYFETRRMDDAVHLSGIRCDGSAHGGCQEACLMYWKEAWLERVADAGSPPARDLEEEQAFVQRVLVPATRAEGSNGSEAVYRCQATEVHKAARLVAPRELDQYVRDVRNWGLAKVVRGLAVVLFNKLQAANRKLLPRFTPIGGGRAYPFLAGTRERGATPSKELELQPGDLVRIRSKHEIEQTLDRNNRNGGLTFDVEMVKYCGRTARVRGRVERVINEQTGRMIHIKSDCVILDGVVCTADYRRFCTRSIYPFWRNAWLEKID